MCLCDWFSSYGGLSRQQFLIRGIVRRIPMAMEGSREESIVRPVKKLSLNDRYWKGWVLLVLVGSSCPE